MHISKWLVFPLLVLQSAVWAQVSVDVLLSEQLASQGRADVLAIYNDFPDLSGAGALSSKEEKAQFVFEALRQNAKRHEPLVASLRQKGLNYQHFWAANAIYIVQADAALIRSLRNTQGLQRLAAVVDWQIDELERAQPEAGAFNTHSAQLQNRSALPSWGVRFLGAPEVWAQGYEGQGVVVAGADTGYDWQHPALRPKYRGTLTDSTANHNYNWFDGVTMPFPGTDTLNPCGFSVNEPCDDGYHGTHTMGIMVGSDGANQVGVAPRAQWIGCRNMDRGNGTPITYLACFQFFLAPTDLAGNNPRPELAPDVVTNSWYCPLSEGCDSTTYPAFEQMITALRASGTVVVAAAGNDGNRGCNTISQVPARSKGVVVVGSHDSLGIIARSSSRGTYFRDSSDVRPDVTMPGVQIRSTVPDSNYITISGTSMAAPHASGVVALMISANPKLRGQVDTIEALLKRSVIPTLAPPTDSCSNPQQTIPNSVYGYGIGDARAAVQLALAWGGVVLVPRHSLAGTSKLRLYPNPASSTSRLEIEHWLDSDQAELSIFDFTGRQMFRQQLYSNSYEIDTQSWPAGVYVLQYRQANAASTVRLVIAR